MVARLGAIDGVRAVAVLAVVVYHLWPGMLPSGYLGVDIFMVVSGFLITGLLVAEHERSGRVRLGAFWGRRLRRLVPAAMLLLVAVGLFVAATGPDALVPSVRAQGIAAIFYVTNWRLVADGVSYGGSFAGESPLVHLWSLAVEEQFYLFWPPLLAALLLLGRGRRAPAALTAAVGAVASATWMAILYEPGHDPLRVYYGTDTRAQAFLVGAVAAFVVHRLTARATRMVSIGGALALVALTAVMLTDEPDLLYRGGFGVVAVCAALVCLSASVPGPITWCLDRVVFRGVGRVSYGIYLWHWPAIVLLTPERAGVRGTTLTALRLGVTGAGAFASWMVVERPIRALPLRRFAFAGAAAVVAAMLAMLPLSATPTIAYASYRTDRPPAPVVVTTTTVAAAPATATIEAAPPTGTAMIVGDSGMFSATPALSAGLHAAGWTVVETAYPGMGLTQPDGVIAGWGATAREHGVDLTIVMIGGWDVGWVRDHGDDAYRGVIDDAVAAYSVDGGKVLWLSVLPGGDVDDRNLEHLFSELPRRHPGVVDYLDIESALRGTDGGWPQVVEGRRLRGPDGWHLCPDGAAAVAELALDHVALNRPGWQHGSWRNHPGYHDPPGLCDP